MIFYEEALHLIRQVAHQRKKHLTSERLPLATSLGRIVAEDILSKASLPAFDNSAMDGFAVSAHKLAGATKSQPICLKISGQVAAGDAPVSSGSLVGAWEIMTGAPVPEGFDAIVKIEDVQVLKDEQGRAYEVRFFAAPPVGQFIRKAGSDFSQGQIVLKQGEKIHAHHLLALAALGLAQVSVYSALRVAYVSTGKELVPFDTEPGAGQIRNSTAPFFAAALVDLQVDLVLSEMVGDEPASFQNFLERALLKKVDLILTTGAVSMGQYDFVSQEIQKREATIHFHRVAIQPGKPLLFAELKEGPVLFGIPGNPVSGVVALRFFIRPFLQKLFSQTEEKAFQARLKENINKPSGLRQFAKAQLTWQEGEASVTVLAGQMSFVVSSLLQANIWASLPAEKNELRQGDLVDVYPLF